MKYLYKLFHQYDNAAFQEMYEHRLASDSIARVNLNIKPIDQPNIFELYYLPTNHIIELVANIYSISSDLNFIFNQLPSVAKHQFITECLIEELLNTNELEGVKSSREEIAESVKIVRMNKNTKKRFESMVKSYFTLINDKFSLPALPMDIKSIYDEITSGEIEDEELPDGEIFRKDITHVLASSGSGKVIHRGLFPEKEINKEIEKLLTFMNQTDSIPHIIKVAIGHYYFGFIHPFYDGNGRTSRFISSLYLSETLGNIPALSLSRGCNKLKNSYLNAFKKTNSIANKGELNFFIDTFLSIISKTLLDMKDELKEKVELLNNAIKKLDHDSRLKSKNNYDFMFILAQNYFFHVNEGLTIKDLTHEIGLSEATTRKIRDSLLQKSMIKQEGIRPAYLSINPEYFEWNKFYLPSKGHLMTTKTVVQSVVKTDRNTHATYRSTLHSNQGWHYQHKHWAKMLKRNKIFKSVSRKATCADNASMENFFGLLKQEMYHGEELLRYTELKTRIEEYIYWYNHERAKGKSAGLSPVEYKTQTNQFIS